MKQPDTVIVGGGSAGAILAARLSEDPHRSVLLIEAGPSYPPDGYPSRLTDPNLLSDDSHDWGFADESSGRTIQFKRGKVLGGSSATNAGVSIRARAEDFERWRARGLSSWSFEQALETFKWMETSNSGDPHWHGRSGVFPILQPAVDELTRACQAFVASARAIGLDGVSDFNGARQHGVGPSPRNIVAGERKNVAMVYLNAAVRSRPNLVIRAGTQVDRVLFEGKRAIGVSLTDGASEFAGETILAAGAFGTPAILMRSGIGPASHLGDLDIPVVADLPVGNRLMDHPLVYTIFALRSDCRQVQPALGALVWSRSRSARSDELDLQIAATHFYDHASSPTGAALVLAAAVTLPDSVGTLRLRSRDPRDAPLIDPRFLSEMRDRIRLLEAIELAREIAQTPPLRDCVDSEIGASADPLSKLRSYHHATSTAPMGADDDPSAVVDEMGSVRGVQALRVVDASILPEIPSAPTNLTVMMVAERIALRYR